MQRGILAARSAVPILQNKPLVDPNAFTYVALSLYSTRSRPQQYGGVVESASRSLPSEPRLNLPFALLSIGQVPVLDLGWVALVKNSTPV
jgi:hypothetical protein